MNMLGRRKKRDLKSSDFQRFANANLKRMNNFALLSSFRKILRLRKEKVVAKPVSIIFFIAEHYLSKRPQGHEEDRSLYIITLLCEKS